MPRPTKRIAPRSKKRAALYRNERIPLVQYLLADNPPCERCGTSPAVDVHEVKTRARGGSLTDPNNLALLCRPCHDDVTRNPEQAVRDGWMAHSWDE